MTNCWINTYFLAYIVVVTECSQVIDENIQKGININDYCPKIGNCEEGTHVMCLYYDPNRLMGPSCSNVVNISITQDYAQMILDIMNRIRSKVTRGIVKGSNGGDLPRGYGIYRLNWDEELATFAQVWANQCKMTSDPCRATKKFSKPGQSLGMSRFTIDGWQPINSPHYSNSTTVTPDKVKYAIISVLKAWYDMKEEVAPEIIKQIDNRSKKILHNQFLHLIYGNVTHIGCGISAYREYAYHKNYAPLNYNSVQIVCNFSSRFETGTQIYTTDPPTKTGYTVRCGCPLGYDEDEDCLCYESGRRLPYSCKDDSSRCKPSVVVLPIFTVDDAPKDRQHLRNNNATLLMNTNEVFDRYDLLKRQKTPSDFSLTDNLQTLHRKRRSNDYIIYSDVSVQRYPADVKSRYFGLNTRSRKNHHRTEAPYHVPKVRQSRRSKQSIFSIAPIFELSIRKTNPIIYQKLDNDYKKDVAPRKDFSEVKKLVSKYLDKKRSSISFDIESDGYIPYGPIAFNSYNNLDTNQNSKAMSNNLYVKQKLGNEVLNLTNNRDNPNDIAHGNGGTDRKLMTLLDKLEREIKEKELNTNEKEMFDSKLHKIYVTLAGKSDFEGTYKPNTNFNNDSKLNEIDNYNIKQDKNYIYRNEYLESMRPKDNYRYVKDNNANYNNEFYISKDNNNVDLITYPKLNLNLNNIENRRMRNVYDVRKKSERNFRKDNFYLRNVEDDDLLDSDRRRYYDNKLSNLRRKIESMKMNGYKNKVREDRKLRPVRPTKPVEEQKTQIRPKEALNTFYIADRARFLHGF